MADLKNTNIDDNLELPSGTTGERPSSPQEGQIRYNTDLETAEFYNGENWRPLSDTHTEATGGTVVDTDIGGVPYRIHYFTETGTDTLTVTNPSEVEYLIVGGGAGGSCNNFVGTGGAGGGVIKEKAFIDIGSYNITVGAGGAGGPDGNNVGQPGEVSSFLSQTTDAPVQNLNDTVSGNGISSTGGGDTGDGRVSQGGAGSGATNQGSTGGPGVGSSITGDLVHYGAGGGGGRSGFGFRSQSGIDGGGFGNGNNNPGLPGTPNTGSGGGGGSNERNQAGGDGGSGIVIVRYPRNSSLDTEPDRTVVATQPNRFQIIQAGLIYHFDAGSVIGYSGSGNTITNLGSNTVTSTVNGAAFVSENRGYFEFDGSNDLIDTNLLFDKDDFTYAAWFRWAGNNGESSQDIIDSIDNNSAEWARIMIRGPSGEFWWVIDNDGSKVNGETGFFPNIGEWYYGVGVWTRSSGLMEAYINGDKVYDTTHPNTSTIDAVNSENIGSNSRADNEFFNGDIAQAQIYDKALTATEVRHNFNADRGRYGV